MVFPGCRHQTVKHFNAALNTPAGPHPWILIPVHNRRELTLACLHHLASIGALRTFTTLVIDDGSKDETASSIAREFPGVRILAGDGHLWWTGAIARGMAEADRCGATAVIWLNDDCLPAAGTLETLITLSARNPAAIVGATCSTGAEPTEASKPVTTAFISRRTYAVPAAGQTELAVDGLSGFCVAVPRQVWTSVGFPDATRFPHYYGDTSYTLLARKNGFAVILAGSAHARLTHYLERAATVTSYVRRQPTDRRQWRDVFMSPRSPFRAASQWHYLQLRYGKFAGAVLATVRLARWCVEFIAAAKG